jgi:hypothetical protein
MKNKAIIGAAVVVVVFLAGFLPQYLKANRLEKELLQSRSEVAGGELRDLIALAYVQANQKNFGLAAETASRFFTRAREAAGQVQDAGQRKAVEDLLASRDRITAELAKADPASINDLQSLFLQTRSATGAAAGR